MVLMVLMAASAAEPGAGCGQIEILGGSGDGWESLAILNFTKDVSTQTLAIPERISAIKVVKLSGYEANLDELTLNGIAPLGYEKKLAVTDHDLIEVEDQTIFALADSGKLTVSARVPTKTPDKSCAFQFPKSNLYHPVTAKSDFYRYTIGDHEGAFAIGDELQIPNKNTLFCDEEVYPGTGHPAAPMQIYLADDGETLYAFFEVFCDNTFDHGKDYAAVHIKDGSRVKTFAVHTTAENEYGRWYFDYTDNDADISWQHMCYVVAIPLAELTNSADDLELAFEYYGTAAATTMEYLEIDGKHIGYIDIYDHSKGTGDYPLPAPGHYLNSGWTDAAVGSWWLYNDDGDYILTLNGANLTIPCDHPSGGTTALAAWGNLDIVLAEATVNTIGTASMRSAMAMWGSENSITGKGTLNLYGVRNGYAGGYGPLTISDAAVNISVSSSSNESVSGISTNRLHLYDAIVTITAHSDIGNSCGVSTGDALTLDHSTLTATTSGSGRYTPHALHFSADNVKPITNQEAEYYEGDAAPGAKVDELTDTDPNNTELNTKKYVKIVSHSDWTGQRADGNYRYADFSWVNDTVNIGTQAKPYLIKDAADLAGLAALVNAYRKDSSTQTTLTSALPNGGSAAATTFAGKYIKLAEDIDLSDRYWTPIGTFGGDTYNEFRYFNCFDGNFNGNGKIVCGLVINTHLAYSYVGLFGRNQGIIDDLTVKVDSIIANVYLGRVGGLVGLNDGGTITNCFVTGSGAVTANGGNIDATYVGGIVGINHAAIENCYCAGSVSVSSTAGAGKESWENAGAAFGVLSENTAVNCYYSTAAAIAPANTFGVGTVKSPVSGVIGMTDAEMKAAAFVDTLNTNADAINTENGDTALKNWIAVANGYPVFTSTLYSYNTPAAITKNGVTATVSYAPVSPQAKDTVVTAAVTLTGTAAAAGRHTIDLTSTADAGTIASPAAKTKNVTMDQAMTAADQYVFRFTLPAKKVDDLVLTHSFTELTSIAVNSTGHKTAYQVGEALDVTGLTVKATLADDTYTTVDVIEDMVSGFDSRTAAANQTLTITYQGKTTAFDITIAKKNPFIDVKESDYFYDAVLWAVENNIASGTSATTFSPEEISSRGQVVTFLWRAYGSPEPTVTVSPFADVENSAAYYYKAVLWAAEKGITAGTSATTFEPEKAVTRGETVTLFWRANGKPAVTAVNPFTDVHPEDYFYAAVMWAYTEKITVGESAAHFGAGDYCERCQVISFLYRGLAHQ